MVISLYSIVIIVKLRIIGYYFMFIESDECCYIYGSVPKNDSFCVTEGDLVILNYIVYNPHDNFTNLTVTWFKSAIEDMSNFEAIPTTSEEYNKFQYSINRAKSYTISLSLMEICSRDLFRDTYSLMITKFTEHENGYYWCELVVDNIFANPSQHVKLYAGEQNSISCPAIHPNQYFRSAASSSEYQCANYSTLSTLAPSTMSSVTSVTTQPPDNIYIAGSLSALAVVVLGALFIALSMLYLCKHRKRHTSKP